MNQRLDGCLQSVEFANMAPPIASMVSEAPPPSAEQRKPSWSAMLCSGALSGVLLWACYFPLDLGWLAWVALIPLLFLVDVNARARDIFFTAWLSGVVLFFLALQWMRVADYRMYATWVGLATYCSLFVPTAIFILRALARIGYIPLVVSFPAVWVALEYFRANFGGGFPWYLLGHTQHDHLLLIQTADLAGAYAPSFVVAAVNALIFEILASSTWMPRCFPYLPERSTYRSRDPLIEAGIVAVLLGGTLAYGGWRLHQAQSRLGPQLALIQGNLDQRLRNDATLAQSEEAAVLMASHYRDLTDWAVRSIPGLDLIVWPETSYPGEWEENSAGVAAVESQQFARSVGARWRSEVLIGLNAHREKDDHPLRYNTALLIHPNGAVGGRYDKIHRVPFGEYVPFRDWLPFMNSFAPYDFDYSIQPGDHLAYLPVGTHHFGVLICYEDTDATLARQYVVPSSAEPTIDFLVNISNDGWFDGTSEHEEHLAICRFRAIETRKPVARAVNMGISAVIDGNGRVLPTVARESKGPFGGFLWQTKTTTEAGSLPASDWSSHKKVAGVLCGRIPLDDRTSLYASFGDWLPQGCWLLITLALLAWLLASRPAKRTMPTIHQLGAP